MANYGIPYMGSKGSIAHEICSIFPKADNFYDLFGGGFSITHFMLLHRRNNYKHFHFNELQSGNIELIKAAIDGKYNYNVFKPNFITRQEFFRDRDNCAYTKLIWSFGNCQRTYIFGKHIESYKHSLHNAVVFNIFDEVSIQALGISTFPKNSSIKARRFFMRQAVRKKVGEVRQLEGLQSLQQLERLQRLQNLENLENLENLQNLEQLNFSALSYEKVKIKPNSVIYCDPPYKGTAKYLSDFDHDKFWEWVMDQKDPVFVSEYAAPKTAHVIIAINKQARLAGTGPTDSVEKMFANDAGKKAILSPSTINSKG